MSVILPHRGVLAPARRHGHSACGPARRAATSRGSSHDNPAGARPVRRFVGATPRRLLVLLLVGLAGAAAMAGAIQTPSVHGAVKALMLSVGVGAGSTSLTLALLFAASQAVRRAPVAVGLVQALALVWAAWYGATAAVFVAAAEEPVMAALTLAVVAPAFGVAFLLSLRFVGPWPEPGLAGQETRLVGCARCGGEWRWRHTGGGWADLHARRPAGARARARAGRAPARLACAGAARSRLGRAARRQRCPAEGRVWPQCGPRRHLGGAGAARGATA